MTSTIVGCPPAAWADLGARVDGLLAAAADRWERTGAIPRTDLVDLAAEGLFGLTVPVEHGGAGLSLTEVVGVHAVVAGRSPSLHSLLVVHGMMCHALVRWGNRTLRERFLPDLAAGRLLSAFALTETGSGADIREPATTVEPAADGHAFVVDGRKRWISNGLDADLYLVFGHEAGAGRAVLVPAGAGVTAVPEPETTGLRAARVANVHFDHATVPAGLAVGGRGFGIPHVVTSCLTHGRLLVAAGAVGVAQAALRIAAEHAGRRVSGGSPLGERQLVRAALADSAVLTDGAVALLDATAQAVEQRAPGAPIAAAKAKLIASRAADLATDSAGRILGALGVVADHPVTRLIAAARTYQVIEGPTELLQDLVGAALVRDRSTAPVSRTEEGGA